MDIKEGFVHLFGTVVYNSASRLIYDTETGEVLKTEDLDTDLMREHGLDLTSELDVEQVAPVMPIPDLEATAESALNRIQEARLRLQANQEKRVAILERMDRIDRQLQLRLDYLLWKFTPVLNQITQERGRGETKAWSCPYGRVLWKLSRGSTTVIDMAKAVAYLQTTCPDAVRVETKEAVLVSKIPDDVRATLPSSIFRVVEPTRELKVE